MRTFFIFLNLRNLEVRAQHSRSQLPDQVLPSLSSQKLQLVVMAVLLSLCLSLWPGSWWPAVSGAALLCTRCRRFTLHFNLTKTGQRTNKNYIPVFTSLKLFNSYQAFKIDNKFGDFNNNLILKMSRLISDYRPLCGQTFRRRYHCHEKIFQKGKIQIYSSFTR